MDKKSSNSNENYSNQSSSINRNSSMNQSSTIFISKKAFINSLIILLILTVIAGILTQIIPSGHYKRITTDQGELIIPDSFSFSDNKPLPIYHWFISWFTVLFAPGNLIIISIIIFILLIGTCFAIIDKTKVLHEVINLLSEKFSKNKILLVGIISLFFMLIGSMFGIFEEMLPLIPIILLLSKNFGWDERIALGMSLLATGFGFAAAISNPFTLGVAQRLANIPVFSGTGYRVVVFLIIYLLLFIFLINSIKKQSKISDFKYKDNSIGNVKEKKRIKKSVVFFIIMMLIMILFVTATLFIKAISGLSLPFIALIFIIIAVGTSIIEKIPFKEFTKTALKGFTGIAPAVLLILLAMGVNYIIRKGNIIDTILFYASNQMKKSGSYGTSLLIYLITLFLNFFVGSASAKAFLLMPILTPLADITGITRQVAILAFQFGDGFSNVIYPTNPVLLIGLAISGLSYPKWFKFTWLLQVIVLIITSLLLCIAVAIGYK